MVSCRILLFAIVVGLAAAKVPSYLPLCGRRNPKIDECIINSISSLRDNLIRGIPELDIPPLDPLKLPQIKFTDQPNFRATANNGSLYGLPTYRITHLHYDMEKETIDLDITFGNLKYDAIYDINAKILVPIVGKGPIILTSNDVGATIVLNLKFTEHEGKKYVYFSSMTTQLHVKDYNVEFKSEGFDSALENGIRQAVSDNHQEILDTTRPNVETAISEIVLNMANKICKHFTFDELFPDRE